ncbi:hypothetical protein TARUN_4397 [Trichoderma arundinaceum]|uniref:Uncharacterized protein n=1 Tax=Trichoderma arundinaceum TaxID=490622 RepID=A0A395NPH3_TRIAR|nr:hypothetical protein TARUN_4397 [Trichoderma arundinaceum]
MSSQYSVHVHQGTSGPSTASSSSRSSSSSAYSGSSGSRSVSIRREYESGMLPDVLPKWSDLGPPPSSTMAEGTTSTIPRPLAMEVPTSEGDLHQKARAVYAHRATGRWLALFTTSSWGSSPSRRYYATYDYMISQPQSGRHIIPLLTGKGSPWLRE